MLKELEVKNFILILWNELGKHIILTLPVSIATTEISFSAMKIIKTRLQNKMEDEFLADNMIIYTEKEITEIFRSDSIIDEFRDLKERMTIF